MLDLVGIHDAHEEPLRHDGQVLLMGEPEDDLGRSIFHDRVVHPAAVLAPIEKLIGELVGHCEVEAVPAGFVEVVGDRGSHEPLELVEIDIERLYAFPLAALLCRRPEVGQEECGEQLGILLGDLGALGGKGHEDDVPLIERSAQVERRTGEAEHRPHGLVADEPLEAVYGAADLGLEISGTKGIREAPVLPRRLVLQVVREEVPHLLVDPVDQVLGLDDGELLLVQGSDDVADPTGEQGSLVGSSGAPDVRHGVRDVVDEDRGIDVLALAKEVVRYDPGILPEVDGDDGAIDLVPGEPLHERVI